MSLATVHWQKLFGCCMRIFRFRY